MPSLHLHVLTLHVHVFSFANIRYTSLTPHPSINHHGRRKCVGVDSVLGWANKMYLYVPGKSIGMIGQTPGPLPGEGAAAVAAVAVAAVAVAAMEVAAVAVTVAMAEVAA
eukprot:10707035-Karenia_brevis.AAC.1